MLGLLRQPGCLPIGIDIGSSGIRLIQLRQHRGRLSLVAATKAEREATAPTLDDQVCMSLCDEIQRRVGAAGFIGRDCVLAIDDRLLRIRAIRQISMPDDEVDRSIRLDAQHRLGYKNEDSFEVDWLRAGEIRQGEQSNDELILVGTEREPLEGLVLELARRGLRPLAVEPGFLAAGRCFSRRYRRAADQGTVRILVDVGYSTTGVTLLRGRHVVFYKLLDIGGEKMTVAAAERLGIEPSTVRELRRQRKQALLEADQSAQLEYRVDRAIFEAVRPLMDQLAQELALCLRYYSVTFRGARPEQCILVGGESCEPKLTEFIHDVLRLDTVIGDPFEDVDVSQFAMRANRDPASPEWAVGVGLSTRRLDQSMRTRDRRRSRRGAVEKPAGTTRVARAA